MKAKQTKNIIFKNFSVVFFVVAIIDALMGLYSFVSTISAYTSQGYEMGEVLKYLVPAQLLPTVIEPLCIIGGIGIVLLGIYRILENNSSDASLKDEDSETEEDIIYESVVEEEPVDDTEDIKKEENVEESDETIEEEKEVEEKNNDEVIEENESEENATEEVNEENKSEENADSEQKEESQPEEDTEEQENKEDEE